MKLTNNEQWILDYLKVDILPRALVVGVCQRPHIVVSAYPAFLNG